MSSNMRGIDTPVRQRRRRIFKEVANLAYTSTNLKDDMEAFDKFVAAVAEIAEKIGVNITITASMPADAASETVKKYL